MIKRKLKKCIKCGKMCYYWKDKICKNCVSVVGVFERKTSDDSYASPNKFKKKYKPTGEKKLFEEIWGEIEDRWCTICGTPITVFSVANFHHIEPKSKRPDLRLVKDNIQLVCLACHQKFHS